MRAASAGAGGAGRSGERVWPDGDDDVCRVLSGAWGGGRERSADRKADREHEDIHRGRGDGSGGGGGGGRDLYRREGSGAGLPESGGDDGGAFCAGRLQLGSGRADLPDGGFGAVARGWGDRVCGAKGRAGEDPWAPDRVRGSRSGIAGAGGSEGSGGDGGGEGERGQAVGGGGG